MCLSKRPVILYKILYEMRKEVRQFFFFFLSQSQENMDSYILNVFKRYTWLRPKTKVTVLDWFRYHMTCATSCVYITPIMTGNCLSLSITWPIFSALLGLVSVSTCTCFFLVCLPSFIFAKKIYICEICCDNFKEISGELLHVVYFTAPVFILKSVALCCNSLVLSKVRV